MQLLSIRPGRRDDDLPRLPLDVIMQRLAMLDPGAAKAIKIIAIEALREAQDRVA